MERKGKMLSIFNFVINKNKIHHLISSTYLVGVGRLRFCVYHIVSKTRVLDLSLYIYNHYQVQMPESFKVHIYRIQYMIQIMNLYFKKCRHLHAHTHRHAHI